MTLRKLLTKRRRIFLLFLFAWVTFLGWRFSQPCIMLVIDDLQTDERLLKRHVNIGDELYFGWIHSLENIPWHEYYHLTHDQTFMLHTISFPSFGAGMPEGRDADVRIEEGFIVMSNINDEFNEIIWLNSHHFVQHIAINNEVMTTGQALPERQLRMRIERRK
ncbi:MAG: DUF1850 domain-containing protein [Defluviitaleaceae bacterium]|nr:DUF1850 domain-containing protein [Defluviitaleaceae bacterium]